MAVVASHMICRFDGRRDPADVAAARRFVRCVLADDDADLRDDMQLIVSELMSNAVEHAEPARVEIVLTENEVEVSVVAVGAPRLPPIALWELPPANAVRGRGLGIVRRVASALDLEQTDGSIRVGVRCVRHV